MVNVTPEVAFAANVHDAEPAFSKSAPSTPLTDASIDNENAIDAELVGDDTDDENDDTDGADVSIVTDKAEDATEVLPATSRSVAVIDHTPADKPDRVHEAPDVLDDTEHCTDDAPLEAVTVVVPPFSAAITLTDTVVLFVRSSVLIEPESSPTARSGAPGADGAVESRVIVDVAVDADVGPELPATSATDDAFNRG